MSKSEGNIKKKASVFLLTLMLLASTFTVVMGVKIIQDTNSTEDGNEVRDLDGGILKLINTTSSKIHLMLI